ncbi:DNA-binding protein [Staphylococcus xylosus]|uniref:DNA-binding protein n=1 Tax=Staphylococcus xylosus TaxID=1288 RepID=UPI000E684ECA|nr:DNA-binding protein [Staphylococcus xylosus]RIM85832.1 DNA-binding protein [Staphylococcus xylosus]
MTQLLSHEASMYLAKGVLELAEKMAEEKLKHVKKKWLTQKEVMEEYRCGHEEIGRWEVAGLTKRKQGPKYYYDRNDIEQVLENFKK